MKILDLFKPKPEFVVKGQKIERFVVTPEMLEVKREYSIGKAGEYYGLVRPAKYVPIYPAPIYPLPYTVTYLDLSRLSCGKLRDEYIEHIHKDKYKDFFVDSMEEISDLYLKYIEIDEKYRKERSLRQSMARPEILYGTQDSSI
jgi:hypothetical protein